MTVATLPTPTRKNPLATLVDLLNHSIAPLRDAVSAPKQATPNKKALNQLIYQLIAQLHTHMEFGSSQADIYQQQYIIEQQLAFKGYLLKLVKMHTLTPEGLQNLHIRFHALEGMLSRQWRYHMRPLLNSIAQVLSDS